MVGSRRRLPLAALQPIGPYILERRLATGGMAEVYLAHRQGAHGFQKRVALKRILPQYARDPEFVSMFINEAKLMASMNHPGIVSVFDFGEADGELFLVMELVEGTNLGRLLREARLRGQRVPLELALFVAREVAFALDYAHRLSGPDGLPLNCVHRDVSPGNVLVDRRGHVRLTDFGIAVSRHRHIRTETGHVRGKLGYMSPEQVVGRRVDARSDVFTLGVLVAEMLIGKLLFGQGPELDVLMRIRDVDLSALERSEQRLPRDVERMLRRSLARTPSERPTAGVFAEAADEIRRRRGWVGGADALASFVARVGLDATPSRPPAMDPGGRATSFLDTSVLHPEVEELVEARPTAPAVYRVRLADGRQLGPMSFPRLVQLFTCGEATAQTPISKGDGPFEAAAKLSELTRFLTSPALMWVDDELLSPVRNGEISFGAMVEEVFGIMQRQDTGVLHVRDGKRRKKIYFVDGRPEFVGSNERRDLLGEYLVESGHCLRMEVEMALAVMPRYGGRLGDALVGLKMMRPVQMFRAISAQVRARLLEVFSWTQGKWLFVNGVRSHEETFPIADNGYEVLRDAIGEAPMVVLDAFLEAHREKRLKPVAQPPVSLQAFRVHDDWSRVLSGLVRPTTAAAQLLQASSLGLIDEGYRALTLALLCGFVEAE